MYLANYITDRIKRNKITVGMQFDSMIRKACRPFFILFVIFRLVARNAIQIAQFTIRSTSSFNRSSHHSSGNVLLEECIEDKLRYQQNHQASGQSGI